MASIPHVETVHSRHRPGIASRTTQLAPDVTRSTCGHSTRQRRSSIIDGIWALTQLPPQQKPDTGTEWPHRAARQIHPITSKDDVRFPKCPPRRPARVLARTRGVPSSSAVNAHLWARAAPMSTKLIAVGARRVPWPSPGAAGRRPARQLRYSTCRRPLDSSRGLGYASQSRKRKSVDTAAKPKAQRNFSDSESKIMQGIELRKHSMTEHSRKTVVGQVRRLD